MDLPRDHVLPDGTTLRIREITPDDKALMLAMWTRTSAESRRARFLGPFDLNESNVHRFTDLDPDLQFAVVAIRGRRERARLVGVARYERDPDHRDHAEFAALVEDGWQGRGVGTALLREVAVAAHEHGITHLTGDILADNVRMLNLVRELGLEYRSGYDEGGIVRSDLEVTLTDRFLDVVEETEREAAQAALSRFFRPERVAVVGASRNPTAIGGMLFGNLLAGGFTGVVYPVNPSARYVQGVAAYPSLADCPEVPDVVFVSLPAHLVNDVVDEAGELGIGAVCIVSAGFAEIGGEGVTLQEDLVGRARGHGLRIVGPNCMGLLNGHAEVRMNGTFSPIFPEPGRVSMSSQSGALGLAVLEHVHALGLGISTFVSVGNKADISGNDLLLYWEHDPDTDVILMYLESFGNPRKFSRIARRISRHKPIVAVKSGRTKAGVRAASSHTAAIASGDRAVDALFRQTGVIRTDTLEEMFDVATLLASQPLPQGNNVAVLTNAGGPGILAADALEAQHLDVPTLSDRTVAKLRGFLPVEAGISNPVDMIASADPEAYARAVEVLGNAPEVDSLFVIFIPVRSVDTAELVAAVMGARDTIPKDKPLIAVIMSSEEGPARELAEAGIPTFAFPEAGARALGRVHSYSWWRRQPLGQVVEPAGIDRAGARQIVEQALATSTRDDGSVWLTSQDATALLEAYGVPLATAVIVDSAEAAAQVQRELSLPVAVKAAAPIHKADVGGVELGMDTPAAAAAAVERIAQALRDHDLTDHLGSYLVQEMVGDGIEMVVGVTHDPSFGPLVLAGAGGTHVELLRDVSLRITPVTDVDVAEMLARLRMAPLLGGYRGSPPADVTALKDLMYRINAMVEDLPEVAELDLNPVFVREEGLGVKAADVRLKLSPTT